LALASGPGAGGFSKNLFQSISQIPKQDLSFRAHPMLSRSSPARFSEVIRTVLGSALTVVLLSPNTHGSDGATQAVAQTPGLIAF
jgi:hypothetical protein